jgi:hypothetical protein
MDEGLLMASGLWRGPLRKDRVRKAGDLVYSDLSGKNLRRQTMCLYLLLLAIAKETAISNLTLIYVILLTITILSQLRLYFVYCRVHTPHVLMFFFSKV